MDDKFGKSGHNHEELENPEVLHEESDVNVRGIVGFGLGLAVCIALSSLALYGMFIYLRAAFTPTPVRPSPLIGVREPVQPENARQLFPEPRLQVDYFGDLDKVQQRWNEQLETYGWLDKKAGIVHIPIDEAMKLTLERGLPARSTVGQPSVGTRIVDNRKGDSTAKPVATGN